MIEGFLSWEKAIHDIMLWTSSSTAHFLVVLFLYAIPMNFFCQTYWTPFLRQRHCNCPKISRSLWLLWSSLCGLNRLGLCCYGRLFQSRTISDYLIAVQIKRMEWSQCYPDLNPTKHMRDDLGRCSFSTNPFKQNSRASTCFRPRVMITDFRTHSALNEMNLYCQA